VADNHVQFEVSGPGRILGVGNGDPSCHEPDVYVSKKPGHMMALQEWRFKRGASYPQPEESAETVDTSTWQTANASRPWGPLRPDETGIFRTSFPSTPAMLAAHDVMIDFGLIDDEGWVYVNGHKVGESHDWSEQPSFSIGPYLHEGTNSIAVSVQNHEGSGGIGKGVSLEILEKPVAPAWQRSVFNGLAQVIVQSDKESGTIILTAHSPGLEPATLNITAGPAHPRPAVQ
jgi:beta-galactosidase